MSDAPELKVGDTVRIIGDSMNTGYPIGHVGVILGIDWPHSQALTLDDDYQGVLNGDCDVEVVAAVDPHAGYIPLNDPALVALMEAATTLSDDERFAYVDDELTALVVALHDALAAFTARMERIKP